MNTIYDGTYVIGQTSATNFQAGPGISITQPSEGTVRIANDETVLWSGNINASQMPVNLSEPLSAFDRIGFTYKIWDDDWAYCEVPSITEKYVLYSNWIDNSQGGYSFAYKLSANSDKTQLGFQRSMFAAWGSTTTSQSSGGFALQKIVGINRKENE